MWFIKNLNQFDIPEDFILFQNSIFASTQKTFPDVFIPFKFNL